MADINPGPVVDWGNMIAGTGLTQAQTGLAQQQSQSAQQDVQQKQMSNQIMRAKMPLIMHALADYTNDSNASAAGGVPTSTSSAANGGAGGSTRTSGADDSNASGATPENSWWDPNQTDAGLRSAFFVPPVTQQEMQRMQRAALTGDPSLVQLEQMRREQRIQSQSAQSQQGSQQLFEAMHTVSDADEGNALAQLDAVAPNASKRIRAMIPDSADEDQAARQYAEHVAQTVHQYTGREVVARPDGTYIDKTTGMTVPGERSGMSDEQYSKLVQEAVKLVPVPDGQGHVISVPAYKANGFPSPDAMVMQGLSNQGHPGAQSTITGAPKADTRAKVAAAVQKVQAQNTPDATGVAAQPGAVTNTPGNTAPIDPQTTKAMQDSSFRFQGPKTPANATRSPDEQKVYDNYTENTNNLNKDSGDATKAASQALTYLRAAQDVMNSKGGTTGAWQSVIAQAARWLPGVQVPATSNYQELAKYLGNAALANAKGIYGPKMTQSEVMLQLHELSPSVSMNDDTVKDLLSTNMRSAQYTIDTAKRAAAYTKIGNDPAKFPQWNQKYWPQEDIVNAKPAASVASAATTKSAAPAAPAAKPTYSDAQIQSYYNTHKANYPSLTLDQVRKQFGAQ